MFLVLLFFPFFMLQIRLSCVILLKKGIFTFNIKCKLLSVVSFSQRVTVRQIFYTRSNPLVDLHFHQVSNCGSLYVRQMCKLERYEAPSFTYSLYVTKKSPVPQTQSVSQNCPPSTLNISSMLAKNAPSWTSWWEPSLFTVYNSSPLQWRGFPEAQCNGLFAI